MCIDSVVWEKVFPVLVPVKCSARTVLYRARVDDGAARRNTIRMVPIRFGFDNRALLTLAKLGCIFIFAHIQRSCRDGTDGTDGTDGGRIMGSERTHPGSAV
jgi:hypothetical protein